MRIFQTLIIHLMRITRMYIYVLMFGGRSKSRVMELPGRERCLLISSVVSIQYSTRTWRTDGWTDGRWQQRQC